MQLPLELRVDKKAVRAALGSSWGFFLVVVIGLSWLVMAGLGTDFVGWEWAGRKQTGGPHNWSECDTDV